MSGKRITNPSLVDTTYPEATSNNAKLLVDWDGLVWARPLPLKLIGNTWIQGSYDAISWDNSVLNDHNYLRVSSDGGITWRIIDLTLGESHSPISIGSPDGGLVISGDETQILTLNSATTTSAGSLSASDKVRINNILWYEVNNVGTGESLYKSSSLVGDLTTFAFKTLVAGTGVVLTPGTDSITIEATGAGGGEVNTGSNQGTLGYGVFDGKSGVDLQFRHIALDVAESTLQLTLDDVNNNIELSLNQTLINHNILTNYHTNEHIDHSAVSILTQEGITGGGDLTSTRTLTLSFDTLTQKVDIQDSDQFAFYRDASAEDEHYQISYSNFKGETKIYYDTIYVPLTTSVLAGLGLSGGGTLDQNRTLYLDINGMPTASYDPLDYVAIYDVSGSTHAKVTLATLIGELAVDITAGNGMDFTTITSTGSIDMGTPTTLTKTTTNSASGTTHEHQLNLNTFNLSDIGDVTVTPITNYYLQYNGSTWVTADPAIGASSPGLPYTSIQFNDSGVFGGNSGLLYDYSNDLIKFTDPNALLGSTLLFGDNTASYPYIKGELDGVTRTLILSNYAAAQNYIKLVGGRVFLGEPTLEGTTFLHIKDPNTVNYANVLKIDDGFDVELLRLNSNGALYIPELASATTTNMLYFNPTTGLVTYGAAPSGSGGVSTLIADSLSGLMVNGGSTSSASTIELDQNDDKLVSASPIPTDYIGFYDRSTGLQSKTAINSLPGWGLYLNGLVQESVSPGNIVNFVAGSGIDLTYSVSTNALTINSVTEINNANDWIEFEFGDFTIGTDREYTLDIKALVDYTILSVVLETDDGTITDIDVLINGTVITGLEGVIATTSPSYTEYTATALNSVVIDDRISMTIGTTYTGTPTILRGKLNIQRV